jgi:hypothetical protein
LLTLGTCPLPILHSSTDSVDELPGFHLLTLFMVCTCIWGGCSLAGLSAQDQRHSNRQNAKGNRL